MIPLVALVEELRRQTEIVRRVAREVFQAEGRAVPYLVGTMIELPRAALTADEIAKDAEFFSFGTNDLTQTTFGLSRDDAGRFLPFYVEQDRKSTRLNSSHLVISYAVFCLKKKKNTMTT